MATCSCSACSITDDESIDLSQIVSYLIFDRNENKTVRSTVYNKTIFDLGHLCLRTCHCKDCNSHIKFNMANNLTNVYCAS